MQEPQLILSKSEVNSVFQLLGKNEDNISYSVAWLLLKSETMFTLVVKRLFGEIDFDFKNTVIYLQKAEGRHGITDIELTDNKNFHIIIEAKKGWVFPTYDQLYKYSQRESFNLNKIIRHKAIVTLTECSDEYLNLYFEYRQINDINIKHMNWQDIYKITKEASAAKKHDEKRWIAELKQYLGEIMTMQKMDSNLVYVVSLSSKKIGDTNLSWKEIVTKKNRYFHPVGSTFPKEPVNYIAFRYDGKLQSIHHVESYKVTRNFHEEFDELPDHAENPHFVYVLGKAIIPSIEVKNGNLYSSGRVWCHLDTLLTSNTISEARDITQERINKYNV